MKVVVIGAGLSGLATAYRLQQASLQQANMDIQVLEARPFPGGRIQPAVENGPQDLGPTWVWPYAQPVVTGWLEELQLTLAEQFDSGAALVDRHTDEFAQRQMIPSQHGIARINGGTFAFIDALMHRLSVPVKFNHAVNSCRFADNRWHLDVSTNEGVKQDVTMTCDRLIVATPPRIAAKLISFEEPNKIDKDLAKTRDILMATETWMAPHAKVVIFYKTAFWRNLGLSGRIVSQVGPLVEVHDHCGPDGRRAALFGFCGVPAQVRQNATEELTQAIHAQLKRCFGADAPEPTQIMIKDWAFEPYTTTEADRSGSGAHPQVLPSLVRQSFCSNSLWFGASEVSGQSAGLIEGALTSADAVSKNVITSAMN